MNNTASGLMFLRCLLFWHLLQYSFCIYEVSSGIFSSVQPDCSSPEAPWFRHSGATAQGKHPPAPYVPPCCRRLLLCLSSELQRLLRGSLGSASSHASLKTATHERLLSLKLPAHDGKAAIPSHPGVRALPLDLWLFSHGLSSHPQHHTCPALALHAPTEFIPTCSWPWR